MDLGYMEEAFGCEGALRSSMREFVDRLNLFISVFLSTDSDSTMTWCRSRALGQGRSLKGDDSTCSVELISRGRFCVQTLPCISLITVRYRCLSLYFYM
jgi:hypothetical protein